MSRRDFLQASAGSAAAVALLPRFARLPLRSPARAAAADGTSAYSMAMHIHSSFSEFNGSMDTHLAQAAMNAVDVDRSRLADGGRQLPGRDSLQLVP